MENKVISIIIPVYNVEKYIRQCLDSVINQTYHNLEIILVDDGSTDASTEICKEYERMDSRIRYIRQENGGASKARNIGLELATGAYIGFVDSDDWIEADMYEAMIGLLEKENADLVCCAFRWVREHQVIDSADDSIHIYKGKEMFESYITGKNGCLMSPAVWNRLFKRECFTGIHFTEGRMFEDKEISCRTLAKIKKGVYYNHSFYNYRQHEASISHSNISKKYIEDFIYMNSIQNKMVSDYLSSEVYMQAAGVSYMLLLDNFCKIYKSNKKSAMIIKNEMKKYKKEAAVYIKERFQSWIELYCGGH